MGRVSYPYLLWQDPEATIEADRKVGFFVGQNLPMLDWIKKVPKRVVAPMRQKFEYKVVFAHMPIAQQILNDTATDGWRLVCKADEQFIFERGL